MLHITADFAWIIPMVLVKLYDLCVQLFLISVQFGNPGIYVFHHRVVGRYDFIKQDGNFFVNRFDAYFEFDGLQAALLASV